MVSEFTLAVDRPFGERLIALERLRCQIEPRGHRRKCVLLEPTQQAERLRREEQLTEAERNPGADERVGQPLIADLAVCDRDGQDRAACRLREKMRAPPRARAITRATNVASASEP